MDETSLRQLLEDVGSGALKPDEAANRLRRLPFVDLGFAKVDHHRVLRQGIPEAVYAPGKTAEQCAAIVAELLAEPLGGPVLLTRSSDEQARASIDLNPGGQRVETTVVWRPAPERPARILVITAGTADLPVARESMCTLEAHGYRPTLMSDCGVAGVHRLLAGVDELINADALIVVAGMEGALASLVAGLSPAPVVAVPTSAGYGSSPEGVTALVSMLASFGA